MAGIGETARLVAELDLKDNFSKGIGSATRSLGGLQSSLGRMGRGVGQVGAGLDKLATRAALAAVGGLTAVVTTAASFEQAFTGVEKTVDGTEAQLAELEGTLRQMARTIPVSFEELAGIGEAGGALGIARESLDEFVDVVARLSVSTNLSSDQAATALGQLGTILHLSGSDFEDFADSLVALGNAGASTEDQIVELAARFAAAGNSAGLSKEEILALASATASMGIEVEAGGTALSQVFNNVATGIGTGSKEIKAFTDTLGISAKDFKKRWTEDALGTFQDFLVELSKLDQFEQADILTRAGITGVRQLSAVKLMTQNIGFLSDQLKVSENAQGALDKESQKFFDTTAGQWVILKNNVRDVANTIGLELLPITNELIKEFIGEINKPGTQGGIKQFAKDLAAGVRGLVTELKGTDFSGIISGMKLAAEVAKGAFDAFRALPEPIQQLAIAALVANKVSGGAIGSIAKGLGNIVFGAGGIFGRGGSPANPVWVQSAVGGVGGGLPLVGGLGLGSTLLLLGPFVAAGITGGLLGAAAAEEFPAPFGGVNLRSQEGADAMRANTTAVKDNTTALTNLGQFDPLNMGGTRKPISGTPKAGRPTIPDTAMSPGGTAVKLPNTAMSNLGTTATEIRKLPPILTRQESGGRMLQQLVSQARNAINTGNTKLGTIAARKEVTNVSVHVTNNVTVDNILRKVSSAIFARGGNTSDLGGGI